MRNLSRPWLVVGLWLLALIALYAAAIRWPESAHWLASLVGSLTAAVVCLTGVWLSGSPRAGRPPALAALIAGVGYLTLSLGPLSPLEPQLLTTKLLAGVEARLAPGTPATATIQSLPMGYWGDSGLVNIHGLASTGGSTLVIGDTIYSGTPAAQRITMLSPAVSFLPLRVLGHFLWAWLLALAAAGIVGWQLRRQGATT